MNNLIVGSRCGGIGDNLVFTPIFKVYKDATIQLLEHPKSHIVAPIFDNICNVKFTNEPTNCPESSHPHTAQKKIEGTGISHLVNCIPFIILTEKEISWAQNFLSNYTNNLDNLLAVSADNNGSKNPNDLHAHYRLLPKEKIQKVIDFYSKKYTVFQFAMSDNYTNLQNCIPILDLTIREMAACFAIIKRYTGIDTGHYHLMLAAGGDAVVFVPNPSYFYSHKEWHYTPELWKNEIPRVEYINFNKLHEHISTIQN